MNYDELVAAALPWHEAGHAVLAERLGFTVSWVTLDRGDGAGAAAIAWPTWLTDGSVRCPNLRQTRIVHRCMMVFLAGEVAEQIHTGIIVPDGKSDSDECYELAVQFFGTSATEAAALIRRLVRRTRAALRKEHTSAAVYGVAENLRRLGTLSGEQVREIIHAVDAL